MWLISHMISMATTLAAALQVSAVQQILRHEFMQPLWSDLSHRQRAGKRCYFHFDGSGLSVVERNAVHAAHGQTWLPFVQALLMPLQGLEQLRTWASACELAGKDILGLAYPTARTEPLDVTVFIQEEAASSATYVVQHFRCQIMGGPDPTVHSVELLPAAPHG